MESGSQNVYRKGRSNFLNGPNNGDNSRSDGDKTWNGWSLGNFCKGEDRSGQTFSNFSVRNIDEAQYIHDPSLKFNEIGRSKVERWSSTSVIFNVVSINPDDLSEVLIVLDGIVMKSFFDTEIKCCCIFYSIYNKYIRYKKLNFSNPVVQSVQGSVYENRVWIKG